MKIEKIPAVVVTKTVEVEPAKVVLTMSPEEAGILSTLCGRSGDTWNAIQRTALYNTFDEAGLGYTSPHYDNGVVVSIKRTR